MYDNWFKLSLFVAAEVRSCFYVYIQLNLTYCNFPAVMIVESNHQAVEVCHCCQYNEDVEDLMRTTPNIILPRCSALWPTCLFDVSTPFLSHIRTNLTTYSVEASAEDIQGALGDERDETNTVTHLVYAVHLHPVHDGDDG